MDSLLTAADGTAVNGSWRGGAERVSLNYKFLPAGWRLGCGHEPVSLSLTGDHVSLWEYSEVPRGWLRYSAL